MIHLTATEDALVFAREQGILASDPVFRPEERDISSNRSEQCLILPYRQFRTRIM